MSGSREESPDWLRCFQAPASSILSVSSDSEPCQDSDLFEEKKGFQFQEWKKNEDSAVSSREVTNMKKGLKSPKKENDLIDNMKTKVGNEVGNNDDEVVNQDVAEKRTVPNVSTATLPLVLPEKVQHTKALVECEGETMDLSGDMGAVGRVIAPGSANGNHEVYLDLKGTIYMATVVPSKTFCIVTFGQSEAKIEAIMNDFIQLKSQPRVYEAETMVEGTLDGFLFDSEDEPDKLPKATSHQTDQTGCLDEQTNEKTKVKAGVGRKRGMTVGGRPQPPKKARKKTLVSKKAKMKK